MRRCAYGIFPGLCPNQRNHAALEQDEAALIEALSRLRRENKISLETLAYVLGTEGGHISRYLKQGTNMSLVNYLRISRALGYRCRIQFEKVDHEGVRSLNKVAHSRLEVRSPTNPRNDRS